MRIAITSDIHANLPALERFLEKARFDFWVDLGDSIGYCPFPSQTLEILRQECDNKILGDHEDHCLRESYSRLNRYAREALIKTRGMLNEEDLDYLRSLKREIDFEIKGRKFLMVHGSPKDPLWEYVFPDRKQRIKVILKEREEDFLLLGHTHIPCVTTEENTTLINPGSLGQPRDGNQSPSYCVLEGDSVEIKRFSYNIDKTAEKIKEEGFPEFLAERLYSGK